MGSESHGRPFGFDNSYLKSNANCKQWNAIFYASTVLDCSRSTKYGQALIMRACVQGLQFYYRLFLEQLFTEVKPNSIQFNHVLFLFSFEIAEYTTRLIKEDFSQPPVTEGLTAVGKEPRYKNIVHLWEFLLELLAQESCKTIIAWSRKEYREFKLKNPEQVALRWGRLKGKKGMNYDKLSRALRYYYQQGIIKKVSW